MTLAPRGIHTLPVEGGSNDWITPREFIQQLGPFGLDPCASTKQPWPCAERSFTYHDDGLRQPWEGRVWLNPPYGPHTGKWLAKLADHGDGIALVPARTETRWFVSQVWERRADAVLFLFGRVNFYRPDGRLGRGNAGHSSVLIAYGDENAQRLRAAPFTGAYVGEWFI